MKVVESREQRSDQRSSQTCTVYLNDIDNDIRYNILNDSGVELTISKARFEYPMHFTEAPVVMTLLYRLL